MSSFSGGFSSYFPTIMRQSFESVQLHTAHMKRARRALASQALLKSLRVRHRRSF